MKAIHVLLIALFGFLIKISTCAMLQMDIVLGEERCVGHELDEDDEATFKVAADSKSKEADKQQLLVTVCQTLLLRKHLHVPFLTTYIYLG